MAIDLIPPVLKTLSFPSTVDVSQGTGSFRITATADGTGSQIAGVILYFDKSLMSSKFYDINPNLSPWQDYGLYELYGYPDAWDDGQSSLVFGIKPINENQTLTILRVVVKDTEGNQRTYLIDELRSMGINTSFSIVGSIADQTPPKISVTSSVTTLNASQNSTILFTLSEPSTNFVEKDITVEGGTLSNFSGSGASYSATFTPNKNVTTTAKISVASGAFTDATGNANTDGSDADNLITLFVDTLIPTIAVSSNKASLQGGDSATLTFTLSEASTNFAASDVTVIGGTLSNFVGSGTSYAATFTLVSNSDVSGTVNIASGVFTDATGNKNTDGSDSNNSLNFLRTTTITNAFHTLSVIVDKNVLGADAVLLKSLKESITYTNGAITKHFVEYAGSTFEYNQIDSLITTVTRDGEFTSEFNKEINDYLNYELNIPYSAAVKLVGVVSINSVILSVAGDDGNFVG